MKTNSTNVPCPTCKAATGSPCTTGYGRTCEAEHDSRVVISDRLKATLRRANESDKDPDDDEPDPERSHASAELWISFVDPETCTLAGHAISLTLEGQLMISYEGDFPDVWLPLTPSQLRMLAAAATEAARHIEGSQKVETT